MFPRVSLYIEVCLISDPEVVYMNVWKYLISAFGIDRISFLAWMVVSLVKDHFSSYSTVEIQTLSLLPMTSLFVRQFRDKKEPVHRISRKNEGRK